MIRTEGKVDSRFEQGATAHDSTTLRALIFPNAVSVYSYSKCLYSASGSYHCFYLFCGNLDGNNEPVPRFQEAEAF